MTTISTTITGTMDLDDKSIALASRLGLYEVRTITLTDSDGNTFPAGTYRLAIAFGGRTVALAALTASTSTLSGSLSLSTTQLEALFAVLPNNRIPMTMVVWDATGKVMYGRERVDIWRNEYDAEDPTPVAVQNSVIQGTAAITAGARTVTVDVTGHGVLANASLAASVLVPAGQDNIYVVASTRSATTLTFTLSSTTPATGYTLTWMVAQ
jgi:hypothetical protein